MSSCTTSGKCGYWNCRRSIRGSHFLCIDHFNDWNDYLIDECPSCGQFKDSGYKLCPTCYYRPATSPPRKPPSYPMPARPKVEHSEAWLKADKGIDQFFVYILKLDGGRFYVGHTRDLRERLWEHKDKKELPDPKLQYFEVLPTRESATQREAELKLLAAANQRAIRKMILRLKDWTSELEYD
ncbi:MAG: hypothetical protein HW414_1767 [Dehalococcoidia bacterium]|nr:hypothetical protein [Dehalococcoidia bacterium]